MYSNFYLPDKPDFIVFLCSARYFASHHNNLREKINLKLKIHIEIIYEILLSYFGKLFISKLSTIRGTFIFRIIRKLITRVYQLIMPVIDNNIIIYENISGLHSISCIF